MPHRTRAFSSVPRSGVTGGETVSAEGTVWSNGSEGRGRSEARSVAAERLQRRRVLVYATNTGTRDITERMENFLGRHGFKVSVMKANAVPPERREAWVAKRVEEDADVLVATPGWCRRASIPSTSRRSSGSRRTTSKSLPESIWDRFDRRDEVWALEQALADLREERRRAVLLLWLRRVLTLGLWRQ